jgi:hypothetical protein
MGPREGENITIDANAGKRGRGRVGGVAVPAKTT